MSWRVKVSFKHFAAFSSEVERARYVLARWFLARNWCGARLAVGLSELRPDGPKKMVSGDRRACGSTAQLAPSGSFPNLLT
jgi:hypothetical protein